MGNVSRVGTYYKRRNIQRSEISGSNSGPTFQQKIGTETARSLQPLEDTRLRLWFTGSSIPVDGKHAALERKTLSYIYWSQ
jgi:hypothetical protein